MNGLIENIKDFDGSISVVLVIKSVVWQVADLKALTCQFSINLKNSTNEQ
jgi:hypothetical protein